jgi:hypothetical protein
VGRFSKPIVMLVGFQEFMLLSFFMVSSVFFESQSCCCDVNNSTPYFQFHFPSFICKSICPFQSLLNTTLVSHSTISEPWSRSTYTRVCLFFHFCWIIEFSLKSSCLHPVFGPLFTPYPLFESKRSTKEGGFIKSRYEMLKLSI